MNKDSLFHAEVVNNNGVTGNAYVKDGGLTVELGKPGSGQGTNPEELFGLSWATCLNETLQTFLKGRGLEASSKVEVHVDYKREKTGPGFYFELKALMSIEGMDNDSAKKFAQTAHRYCPVSKIIGDYEHAVIEVVPYI